MSKLFSSRKIVVVLHKRGFMFVHQRGSHAKFRKHIRNSVLTVIVPMNKKEIPEGTLYSILRQANLSKEDIK